MTTASESGVEPRRRKLIEVALPVTDISLASIADKNRKVGTIKNIHKWFAPMPSPAMRALIFAALMDDPGDDAARAELLNLVKQLVPETGTAPPEPVLRKARDHIRAANGDLPAVFDPFSGGGSTLVEAGRLGLPTVGSDLNPVAALITRTLTELLPPLAQVQTLSCDDSSRLADRPFEGLADDVRHYGRQVENAVRDRIDSAYPAPPRGKPVAWLWARTVPCPNPGCPITVPLLSSAVLSRQPGREATAEAVVGGDVVRFVIHHGRGAPDRPTKVKGRARFACPACGAGLGEKEIRAAGLAGDLGQQLMAVCVDTEAGRTFLSPGKAGNTAPLPETPEDLDEIELGSNTKNFSTGLYGLTHHADIYTPRQLAMLAAFADEVARVPERVRRDGGTEQQARAIATLLGLGVSKLAQSNSTLVRWRTRIGPSKAEPAFGTQAMPMLWDFAEPYPFGESVGSWSAQLDSLVDALPSLPDDAPPSHITQTDARTAGEQLPEGTALLVTDPPYFGQINYADLSDYFYWWLRRALRGIHPDLFGTITTPKEAELVANPARHSGSVDTARHYFIDGFTKVFTTLRRASRADLPMLVVYAHKQDEREDDGIFSTGWESLLEAVLAAQLAVVGTWPIEAASTTRMIGQSANALSSYVVLACRSRELDAGVTDRRGLITALRAKLPTALRELQQGGIAPVDLAQATIGPGMALFSAYDKVVEPDGSRMPVRKALALINQVLAEVLSEQESDLDSDSRWCVKWFEQRGWDRGDYGDANSLATAYNTSVSGLERAGVLKARAGDVALFPPEKLPSGYDPQDDDRATVWELTLHLSTLLHERGLDDAAALMARARGRVDVDAVKELAYLLFSICERKGLTQSAIRFNGLVTSWEDLTAAARDHRRRGTSDQETLPIET